MIALILVSCLTVGIVSYFIAKKELDAKGRVILKNSVEMALLIIDAKNNDVKKGILSLEEAQEQVKVYLAGEKSKNGTRQNNGSIDLGKNGYFIVYSQDGTELMHPTLEGENVWNAVDKENKSFLVVQDKINKSKAGGGYSHYTWNFPNSNMLGKKVAYSKLDPNWGWVVTSTAYMIDYNKGALSIMIIMIIVTLIMLLIGIFVSRYFISGITEPIEHVVYNMKLAEKGDYSRIIDTKREDELGDLVSGFNEMVNSINSAYQNVISKEEKITYLAYYDQLSGLPNRNMFKEHINKRIRIGNIKAFIILFDIKDFKLINSILGCEFGNKIIGIIGSVLNRFQNDDSFTALLSGDEFAVWIENCDELLIEEKVMKIKKLIIEELRKIDYNQNLYFHISYASYPDDGLDFESCYKKAMIAMNFAKQNGKIKIFKFEQTMEEAIEYDSKLRNYVEIAINEDEFDVYYQNKVSIKANEVVGVEALARWNSKVLGFVSPSVFIPSIDKANLTAKFSKLIIKKVLNDYPRLKEKFKKDITVSINISPLFFFEKDFTKFVTDAVKSSGVNPNNVILEITEDIFINDFDSIKKIISELRSFGIKISLDDFGTGYSSLNYLKNVDFDELKIDKSFIQGVLTDERNSELLKAIDHIARIYDYSVVAEGVETQEQLEKIINSNFDIVQGYIYSRPEPL